MPTLFGDWEADWNHAAHLEDCMARLTRVLLTCTTDDGPLTVVAGAMLQAYTRELRALTWTKESRVFVLPKCISRNGEHADLERVRRPQPGPDERPAFGN